MTADGHTKGSIRRTAIHALMNGAMSIQHKREELILYNPRARLTQAPDVLHTFIVVPVALINCPLTQPPGSLTNSPFLSMAERWRNNVQGAQQSDSSSTDIELEPDEEIQLAEENPWKVLEFGKFTIMKPSDSIPRTLLEIPGGSVGSITLTRNWAP